MTETPTRGYTITKDDYTKRLNRIEGQVRGIRRMIDEDTYCIDVLTQVSAVTKALQAVAVRSEEHTSELQSLMRISYAVFCLKKKTDNIHRNKIKTKPQNTKKTT